MEFSFDDKIKTVFLKGSGNKHEIQDLLFQFEDDYEFKFVEKLPGDVVYIFDADYLNGFNAINIS